MKEPFSQNKDRPLQTGIDPDILERKSGGGGLMLFGLPFLLSGLWVLAIGLGPGWAKGGFAGAAAAALFGLIFASIGFLLVFGRSGLIIDRRENRIVRWQGLLVPLRRSVRPLDSFDRVRLDCVRGDKSTSYPVQLMKGDDRAGAMTVDSSSDYQRSRRNAEALARFVRKPLEDRSSGNAVIRDPDHLDESLRERARRLGEEDGFFPPQPVPMRTRIEQTVDGVILSIPSPLARWGRTFRLVIALVVAGVAGFVVLPVLLSIPKPPFIQYLIVGLVGLFAIVMPLAAALRPAPGGSTRVTATRAFLRVEEGTGRRQKMTEIPADELEELEFADRRAMVKALDATGMKKLKDFGDTGTPRLPDGRPVPRIVLALARLIPSPGITARSDRAVVNFGKGLPDDEIVYLHYLIRKILTE